MDAAIIGDSWVHGDDSWPMQIARDKQWQVINVARSGSTVTDCIQEQVDALCGVDESTLFIIHCGGNDLLRSVKRNFHKHLADCLLVQLGRQPVFYARWSEQITGKIVHLINTLHTQHGGRRFLVCSNTY